MCPIFRVEHTEAASPRAKANLFRELLGAGADQQAATESGVRAIADLCVNCHQCRLECPAAVDIPKLMIEAKAQYVASNGLGTADWLDGDALGGQIAAAPRCERLHRISIALPLDEDDGSHGRSRILPHADSFAPGVDPA